MMSLLRQLWAMLTDDDRKLYYARCAQLAAQWETADVRCPAETEEVTAL